MTALGMAVDRVCAVAGATATGAVTPATVNTTDNASRVSRDRNLMNNLLGNDASWREVPSLWLQICVESLRHGLAATSEGSPGRDAVVPVVVDGDRAEPARSLDPRK